MVSCIAIVSVQHYLENDWKHKHSSGNGETRGRCQHKDIKVYYGRIQLDSHVCSADLHNNPRQHVCTMVRVPLVRTSVRMDKYVPWSSSTILVGKGHTYMCTLENHECIRVPIGTTRGTMVLVRTYTCTYHGTRVLPWYMCTPTHGPRGTSGDRRRAQGGDADSGLYPSLHCSGDSRGGPRR
jgi:hypothetical protein